MSIQESFDIDNTGHPLKSGLFHKFFLPLLILLAVLLGIGIGRLGQSGRDGVKIEYAAVPGDSATSSKPAISTVPDSTASVYASSKGTRYYFSWCKSTVSTANRVNFASESLAKAAGYTLATNCKPK